MCPSFPLATILIPNRCLFELICFLFIGLWLSHHALYRSSTEYVAVIFPRAPLCGSVVMFLRTRSFPLRGNPLVSPYGTDYAYQVIGIPLPINSYVSNTDMLRFSACYWVY